MEDNVVSFHQISTGFMNTLMSLTPGLQSNSAFRTFKIGATITPDIEIDLSDIVGKVFFEWKGERACKLSNRGDELMFNV